MDEKKEKTENELRFLTDTLDAGLISQEEFEKEKARIGAKLQEQETASETKHEEIQAEKTEPVQEIIKEPVKIEEEKEDALISKVIESQKPPVAEEEKKEEIKPEPEVPAKEASVQEKSGWFKYAAIAAIILFAMIAFSFVSNKEKVAADNKDGPVTSFIEEDVKSNVTILTSKECSICDTARMTEIIKKLFSGAETNIIDESSPEADGIINELGIEALPAYIFSKNIEESKNFDKFKSTLSKKGDRYLMSSTAAGSSYFFKREKISGKLGLFLLKGSAVNQKTKDNLQEFLSLFEDKIDYSEQLVEEGDKERLREELGITTFPTFMINNQYKIIGVFSADKIKEYFCQFNNFEECAMALSKEVK